MMHGWGFTGRAGMPQRFEEQYHCYSVAYADKAHLEEGDKILLPPSAFDTLARLQVDYPMLFQLQSTSKGTMTHCGVLEFTAEEGSCYVPFWMMQNLLIEEGSLLTVTNVSLPKATFCKLRPQHVDFLEISNPRAVLEMALRKFSCVTKGDVICLPYNDKNYYFELMEVRPGDAACIIETDCNVDFDAPVGYKEPKKDTATTTTGGSLSGLTNLPKQSAYAPAEARSSACPSPTPSSLSAASGTLVKDGAAAVAEDGTTEAKKPPVIRIVDGKIIKPEDEEEGTSSSSTSDQNGHARVSLAPRVGGTGVQQNAAIPVRAPEVDYWAVSGDGVRLDGKSPSVLKDKEGNVVDVSKVRAEAAAKRAAAAAAAAKGEEDKGKVPVRKNKSRTGGKYSRLKKSDAAFGGRANRM